jgi:hypothetical protein
MFKFFSNDIKNILFREFFIFLFFLFFIFLFIYFLGQTFKILLFEKIYSPGQLSHFLLVKKFGCRMNLVHSSSSEVTWGGTYFP